MVGHILSKAFLILSLCLLALWPVNESIGGQDSKPLIVPALPGGVTDSLTHWLISEYKMKHGSAPKTYRLSRGKGAEAAVTLREARGSNKFFGLSLGFESYLRLLHDYDLVHPVDSLLNLSGMDDAFRPTDSWVGLAWITWASIKPLRDKDGCKPSEKWLSSSGKERKHCVEDHGNEHYVVKIKTGHEGWPLHGFALIKDSSLDAPVNMAKLAISKKAAERFASKFFLFVALDSVRDERSVEFQLYEPGKSVASHTTTDTTPAEADTKKNDGGKVAHNSCGGTKREAAACPSFIVPPGDLQRMFDDSDRWP